MNEILDTGTTKWQWGGAEKGLSLAGTWSGKATLEEFGGFLQN